MSCEECSKAQKSDATYYFRWKNADIGVKGCKTHIKEIFDVLGDYLKPKCRKCGEPCPPDVDPANPLCLDCMVDQGEGNDPETEKDYMKLEMDNESQERENE